MLSGGIQPTLGRPFLAPFGHDAGGVRFVAQRNGEHFFSRCHFQIYWQLRLGHDRVQVAVADMATVFTQMHGNAITARCLNHTNGAHRIGVPTAACIADGGYMVNVDAESEKICHALYLPTSWFCRRRCG